MSFFYHLSSYGVKYMMIYFYYIVNINILKRYSNYHISSEEYGKDPYEAIKHKVKIEAENVYLAEDKGIKYIDYGYNDAIYTVKIKFTTPKGKELAYEALDKLGVGFGGKVDDSLDSMIIIYYSCFETFKNAQKILYSRFAPVWYVDEIIVDCLDFYEEPLLKTYDTKTLRLVALPAPTPQENMYLSSLEEYNEFMQKYDIERLTDTKYMSLIYSDDVEFNEGLFEDNFVFVFLKQIIKYPLIVHILRNKNTQLSALTLYNKPTGKIYKNNHNRQYHYHGQPQGQIAQTTGKTRGHCHKHKGDILTITRNTTITHQCKYAGNGKGSCHVAAD